jgi:hypothetical protein
VERQMLEFTADGDATPASIIIPSDFRKVAGVLVSFRTIRRVGDRIVSTTVVDQVDVNYGVLPKFFDPPGPLE